VENIFVRNFGEFFSENGHKGDIIYYCDIKPIITKNVVFFINFGIVRLEHCINVYCDLKVSTHNFSFDKDTAHKPFLMA
jgi:hypothetical protein